MSEIEMQSTGSKFACPACGYRMWDDPLGSYENCDVCGWQDDARQRIFPFSDIGANHQSLYDYQKEVRQREADAYLRAGDHRRDPNWRWLTEEDRQDFSDGAPTTGQEYFLSIREADARAAEYGDYKGFEYWRRD